MGTCLILSDFLRGRVEHGNGEECIGEEGEDKSTLVEGEEIEDGGEHGGEKRGGIKVGEEEEIGSSGSIKAGLTRGK